MNSRTSFLTWARRIAGLHVPGGSLPDLAVVVLSADDGDGTMSMLHDLVADRTQQKAREPSVTAVADDDQVGVAGLAEQHKRRLPFNGLALAFDGAIELFHGGDCLACERLGGFVEALVKIRRVTAAVDDRRDL